MAGDWIPMRLDLDEDPAVVGIAAALRVSELQVVGYLWKVWSTASRQTTDGRLPNYTARKLDELVGVSGFSAALIAQGWLVVLAGAVSIPRFDHWLSQGAKARIGESIRKRLNRSHIKCPDSPDNFGKMSGPHNRTEENNNNSSAAAAETCQSVTADREAIRDSLVAAGLSAALTERAVQTLEPRLLREVISYHAEQNRLRNPVGALRSMLATPLEWGFELTPSGWRRPQAPLPPGETDEQRKARIANDQLHVDQVNAAADRDKEAVKELQRQRRKGGVKS